MAKEDDQPLETCSLTSVDWISPIVQLSIRGNFGGENLSTLLATAVCP